MDTDTLSHSSRLVKILVVDDDDDNLLLMTYQLLQIVNCSILSAKDGQSALSTAQSAQPDLILLDIMMPHMDGLEVVSRLKQDLQTRAIPVIAVTAMARPEDRTVALHAGCDEYLSKPYELEHLERLISHYLDISPAESNSEIVVGGGRREFTVTANDVFHISAS